MRIGLIGYGQIGRSVADAVRAGLAGDAEIGVILVRDATKAAGTPDEAHVVTDPAQLYASDAAVVVEVGGHAALREHIGAVLEADKDVLTVSVGAFADPAFFAEIERLTQRTGRRVLVPSGAIAGLDMISAAALAPLDSVTHTTRKHPRAFTPEQLGTTAQVTEPMLLFDGPARDGVGRFPENVNVAAAVSLAGIGLDRTRLRVYADPTVTRNVHEVEVIGHFGQLSLRVENQPSANPKTGRVVPLSVAKALRNLTAPIVIGL
jgi:aspartate dehydrogenase